MIFAWSSRPGLPAARTERDPQHGAAHAALGQAESMLGEHGAAVASFTRAGSLGVSTANFHANFGLELLQLGRLLQAEVQLRRATEMDPSQKCEGASLRAKKDGYVKRVRCQRPSLNDKDGKRA